MADKQFPWPNKQIFGVVLDCRHEKHSIKHESDWKFECNREMMLNEEEEWNALIYGNEPRQRDQFLERSGKILCWSFEWRNQN